MISRPTSQTPTTSAEPDDRLFLLPTRGGCSREPNRVPLKGNPFPALTNRCQYASRILISSLRCRSRGSHAHHTNFVRISQLPSSRCIMYIASSYFGCREILLGLPNSTSVAYEPVRTTSVTPPEPSRFPSGGDRENFPNK
jgi:hypothetical protein